MDDKEMKSEENMTMDLSGFKVTEKAAEGSEMILNGPGGGKLKGTDGNPIVFTLLGSDSEKYQRIARRQTTNRLNKRVSRGGKIKVTGDELEDNATDILVACTKSWTDNFVYNGVKLECTPVNVRMLYEKELWIREQVDEFINDRDNYLGN